MDLLTAWHDASMEGLPDLDVWDAHTHTGANDPDGVVGTARALLVQLDEAGHRGAVVMTSQEPHGYPPANDRILREAVEADGRIIPFCRVDPTLGAAALAELERCIELGFRGLKLHPRGENFSLALPIVGELAGMAAAEGLPVLIHAGRGIPRLGDDVEHLLSRHPDLDVILAHAAISDLGQLSASFDRYPGMYFDLAWWSTASLLALATAVPPERLLYASDTPYGSPLMAGAIAGRIAQHLAWSPAAVAGVMGGNLLGLVEGRRPVGTGRVASPPGPNPLLLAAYADLQAAIAQILAGGSGEEALQLAARACRTGGDHRHAAVLAAVGTTIDIADTATPDRATAVRAMIVAASALLTPAVTVPEW